MARHFEEDRRLHVTVNGADRADFGDGIVSEERPRIGVHLGRRHPSSVILPFLPSG